jgi:hypothetical protein
VVNLSNPTNVTILNGQGTVTIGDNDSTPSLSINNVSVTEGDTGAVTATVTVTLSAASGRTVTVNYATANGTATAGADYTSTSGTLTFLPGVTTQTVSVDVIGDVLNEANETFTVNLTSPVNATGTPNGTVTITENDPLPSITIDSPSIAEGNAGTKTLTFNLALSAASGRTVTVLASTANGTASSLSDYVARSNITVTFPAGLTAATFTVTINGDGTVEANETLLVNLTSPSNATIGVTPGTGTITNDD